MIASFEPLVAGNAEDLVCDFRVPGVGGMHVATCAEERQLADLGGSLDDLGGVGDANTVAPCGVFLHRGIEALRSVLRAS